MHSQQLAEEALRATFVTRIREKEVELKEEERKLHLRFEELKHEHTEQRRVLDEKRKTLDEESGSFRRKQQLVLGSATLGPATPNTPNTSNTGSPFSHSNSLFKSQKQKNK